MGIFNHWPYTNIHEMNLDWFLHEFRKVIAEWLSYNENWEKWKNDTDKAFQDLERYVKNYFDNLDLQEEVNNKLDEMHESGALADLIRNYIGETEEVWSWGYNGMPGTQENPHIYATQDLTLIKMGNGKNALIDMGWYYPNQVVNNFFSERGVTRLDYLLITHYHNDHVGNLPYICEILDVEEATIFLPMKLDPAKASAGNLNNEATAEALAEQYHMTIIRPEEQRVYNLTDILKLRTYNTNHKTYYDAATTSPMSAGEYNDCCNVYEVFNPNTSILFTGDITPRAEGIIAPELHKMDIVYMPHHGGNFSLNDKYFWSIYPEVYVAQNGYGHDKASENDYMDRYSRDNLEAQRRRIPVLATSVNDDNIVHYTFNSFNYQIEGVMLPDNCTGTSNWSLNDITEATATVGSQITLQELWKKLPNNSETFFFMGSTYKNSPHFNGSLRSGGSKIYANNIQYHLKTDSLNYLGNTSPREYGLSLYVKSSKPAGDVHMLQTWYNTNADAEAGILTQNLIPLNVVPYYKIIQGNLPAQETSTLIQWNDSHMAVFFGDDVYIDDDGNIAIRYKGTYEITLGGWTLSQTVGNNFHATLRSTIGGTILAGLNHTISNTGRAYFQNSNIMQLGANSKLYVDYRYEGTSTINIMIKRLSRENGVTLDDFILHD